MLVKVLRHGRDVGADMLCSVNIFDKLSQQDQSNFDGRCATVQVVHFCFKGFFLSV